jgi:hypothetical protein
LSVDWAIPFNLSRLLIEAQTVKDSGILGCALSDRGVRLRAKAGELLTPEELSELLKKPVKWIYEKRRPRCVNPIPATPMGRESLRFQWKEIVSWLDSCRQKDSE